MAQLAPKLTAVKTPQRLPHPQAMSASEKKPHQLSRVINTLKCAVEKLQLAQGLEAEKARQLTLDHYISQVCLCTSNRQTTMHACTMAHHPMVCWPDCFQHQVELLQTAFTSLADAVLEELGEAAAAAADGCAQSMLHCHLGSCHRRHHHRVH